MKLSNSIQANVASVHFTVKNVELLCVCDKVWLVPTRGETIWVNAVLHIVFEYIALYCHIAIFDWILVKRHSIWKYGLWQ